MREEYDFSHSIKNPYAKYANKQTPIPIENDTIDYFKGLAKEMGTSYQSLINAYLTECARKHIKLEPKRA